MTIEEAIPVAKEYVQKLFPGHDYRLEEVILHENGRFAITLSFYPQGGQGSMIAPFGGDTMTDYFRGRRAAIGIDPRRVYKVVEVSPDGRVQGVTMREIVVG